MKTKFLKGISLFGLAAFSMIMLISNVEAREQCTTYKNYYFYSEINWAQGVADKLATTDPWPRGHASYFPAIPSTARAAKGSNKIIKDEVCLQKGDQLSKESAASCGETWDLTKYYNREVWLAEDPTTEQFTIDNNESSYTYRSENSTDNDGDPVVTTYYRHGIWFTVDNNDDDDQLGGASVVYTGVPVETLVAGSFIPLTDVNMQDPQNGYMRSVVRRSVTGARFRTATPFEVYWPANNGNVSSVLTPALYYIEYQDNCQDVPDTPTYKATINYYYENTTTRVEFKNESNPNPFTANNLDADFTRTVTSPEAANASCTPLTPSVDVAITREENGETVTKDFTQDVFYRCSTFNATIDYYIEEKDGTVTPASKRDSSVKNYSKTGLANGANDSVKSPTIKNCKLKKNDDKTVEYTINNADFAYDVVYVCDDEEAPVNPKTGIALIITAWVVGFGALGYSAYYFMNAKKEENAEL